MRPFISAHSCSAFKGDAQNATCNLSRAYTSRTWTPEVPFLFDAYRTAHSFTSLCHRHFFKTRQMLQNERQLWRGLTNCSNIESTKFLILVSSQHITEKQLSVYDRSLIQLATWFKTVKTLLGQFRWSLLKPIRYSFKKNKTAEFTVRV